MDEAGIVIVQRIGSARCRNSSAPHSWILLTLDFCKQASLSAIQEDRTVKNRGLRDPHSSLDALTEPRA